MYNPYSNQEVHRSKSYRNVVKLMNFSKTGKTFTLAIFNRDVPPAMVCWMPVRSDQDASTGRERQIKRSQLAADGSKQL